MSYQFVKRFLHQTHYTKTLFSKKDSYRKFIYEVVKRCSSQMPTAPDNRVKAVASGDEDSAKWKLELAWLSKALQACRWALPIGNGSGNKVAPSGRSLMEIIAHIQKSKIGIEGWSLSDLTIGLYLIYLRQASLNTLEDVKGVQITSEPIVHDLIYHLELAKGCYKANVAGLVRNCMLRENNVLKFVEESSVMRPGYYIGVDPREKLVILGIRGTHTVYDLITDMVSSSEGEVTFEGYSTHFGTAEAARWFLTHEIGTLKKCLQKYEGFRLRLVGHSLGGAIASLIAIMLRKKSREDLGFSPDIVSAVGYATPPCVSRELAESCSDFVMTVVMQDDIIPRLSVASLARLRHEILQTDWMSVVENGDWRSVIDLVSNTKQVVSSIQDVARKLADYASFGTKKVAAGNSMGKESMDTSLVSVNAKYPETDLDSLEKKVAVTKAPEELFVPGAVYFLKRSIDAVCNKYNDRGMEYFTLWKRHPGEHFQKIVLSGNIISDHKCDSHYYALRDVIKGLPRADDEGSF